MASSSNTQMQMEMEEGVKLLTVWRSGFGLRAELALKAKGIEFQTLQEDFSSKSALLLTSSPVYKKVPVLIHNGRAICESRIIIEYIDETWSQPPHLCYPAINMTVILYGSGRTLWTRRTLYRWSEDMMCMIEGRQGQSIGHVFIGYQIDVWNIGLCDCTRSSVDVDVRDNVPVLR